MRLSSNIFLIAYAMFLIFCIGFVIRSSDSRAIDDLICAVSIVSASISLAELFYSKATIDKEERTLLTNYLSFIKCKDEYYTQQIFKKYGNDAEEMISVLSNIFNEDEIKNLFSNDLSLEKKEMYLEKVKSKVEKGEEEEKISEIINSIFNLLDEDEGIIEDLENEDDAEIEKLLQYGKRTEQYHFNIAKAIVTIGIFLFLVILAWNNIFPKYVATINNVLTIFAFLTVVLNLLIKDNYRAKSLEKIANMKKNIYKL